MPLDSISSTTHTHKKSQPQQLSEILFPNMKNKIGLGCSLEVKCPWVPSQGVRTASASNETVINLVRPYFQIRNKIELGV